MLYKSLVFTNFSAYMKNMFSIRSSSYDLCGNHILSLSKPKTTNSGLNFLSYFSAKQWNALPDFFLHCVVFVVVVVLFCFFFWRILRLKYRMLLLCRFLACIYLY